MSKKTPVNPAEDTQAETAPVDVSPAAVVVPQDEFTGHGGSYVIDPITNQRSKNIGDTQHG